ncbi:hypothetical protein, partial [Corallococcus aberystwythensis]
MRGLRLPPHPQPLHHERAAHLDARVPQRASQQLHRARQPQAGRQCLQRGQLLHQARGHEEDAQPVGPQP